MFYQMTSFLIVLSALCGTTLAAIYIGDNQRIDGNVRSGPFDDVVIGGRPNYGGRPNINRYPANGRQGIYVGNGNTIRGTVRSDLPPGVNINGLLANLPSGNRGSGYQSPNYNRYQPPSTYNSYPQNGRGGIVIGNGVTHRGGISAPLY